MTAFMGELIGTALLIFLGNGVVANVLLKDSKAEGAGWLVICAAWGLAVTFAIYAVGQFSGAHINPAVTLGLAATGAFPWADVPKYITAQMLGAMLGATAVYLHFLPHWKGTTDADAKHAVFCTAPAIKSRYANLLSEISGTFMLLFGLMAIGSNAFTEGLNPLIVGFLIVAIGLSIGGTTGFAINPARDLGPRIAHALLPIPGKRDSNWGYALTPVLGPIIGGVFGALLYQALYNGPFGTEWMACLFWASAAAVAAVVGLACREHQQQQQVGK